MLKNNPNVPWERQMLYIFRHWDEIHKKLETSKETVEKMQCRLLETRLSCSEKKSEIKKLKKTCAELRQQIEVLQANEKSVAGVKKTLREKIKSLWE